MILLTLENTKLPVSRLQIKNKNTKKFKFIISRRIKTAAGS
jgi:hypothetical protein